MMQRVEGVIGQAPAAVSDYADHRDGEPSRPSRGADALDRSAAKRKDESPFVGLLQVEAA